MTDFLRVFVCLALLSIAAYHLISLLWRWIRFNMSLPPGPRGVPILGYLPFMKKDFHLELTDLSRKYGPCFSLRLGGELIVVLADHNLIREAFRRQEFDCRPANDFMNLLEGYGIINAEGKLWKEQRRFIQQGMRQFGIRCAGQGRDQMEARIMNEVTELVSNVEQRRNEPFLARTYLAPAVSNVICSLLMSTRFGPQEPRFLRFQSLFEEGFRLFTVIAAAGFIPVLRLLPAVSQAFRRIRANLEEIRHFYREVVDQHKASFVEDGPVRDLVDTYILESRTTEEQGTPGGSKVFAGKEPDRQVHQVIGDLFSAGTETVQTTLRWAVVFALRHPELQLRVQQELDRVVGRSRLPSLNDLPNLPFTEAFLMEVMRRATAVPLGTPHAASKTTTLNGMTIPKGAQVVPLIHAVHMDPNLWDKPEEFNPERFLNHDGTAVVKPASFIPFGVGRRTCLGIVLAKAELFLFLSSLLHAFHLRLPDGVTELPSLDGLAGATVSPKDFQLCAVPRPIVPVDGA